jgi:leucyl/phenylalanyl-tRNA--protein transferase
MQRLPSHFPMNLEPDEDGLVVVSDDLTPAMVIEGYTKGLFAWTGKHPVPWFSPDPRMILHPTSFRRSRSLSKTLRHGAFEVRFDFDFAATLNGCAWTPRRDEMGTWITPNMVRVWGQLHELGLAHSVEVWRHGALCGGLYGVAIGRAFFGESMFHRVRDASKIALHALCLRLETNGYHFIDCQQDTPHLASLGGYTIPRVEYLSMLSEAISDGPPPGPWNTP